MASVMVLALLLCMMLGTAWADVCRAVNVSAGTGASCAVLADGSARCWGSDDTAQLGQNSSVPSDASGANLFGANLLGAGRSVVQLAAHWGHACALLNDSSVSCWGQDANGELGASVSSTSFAVSVDMGASTSTAYRISTGSVSSHSCAAVSRVGLVCWGGLSVLPGTPWVGVLDPVVVVNASKSSLFNSGVPSVPPTRVDLGPGSGIVPDILDVCTGAHHICVLTAQLGLKCFGVARYGALGLGGITNTTGWQGSFLPSVDLGAGRFAVQISCGWNHTCAVLDNGALKCWGYNNQGQLGYGDNRTRGADDADMGDNLLPVDVGTDRTVQQVTAGEYHTCALLDSGEVKCWGDNMADQLGHACESESVGSVSNQMGNNLAAVNLGLGRTALSVSAGREHTCAVLDDGSVKCWGSNIDWPRAGGQLGVDSRIQHVCEPQQTVYLGTTCLADTGTAVSANGTSSPQLLSTPSPSSSSHSASVGVIVGAVVAGVLAIALIGAGVWWWRTRSHSSSSSSLAGTPTAGVAKLQQHQAAQVMAVASDEVAVMVPDKHSLVEVAATDVKIDVGTGSATPFSPGSTRQDGKDTYSHHAASIAAPASGVLPDVRSTPPVTSPGSSRNHARDTSSSSHVLSAAPSSGIMLQASVDGMRIPWSNITLGGLLGEGGFGKVYKAKWQFDTVAVKVLNTNRTSAAAIENLHREALIMSELRHPCIARVFGIVDEDPHHALVMQYYPKGTLARYMTTAGYTELELPAKLHLALQVASGMRFMHERPFPVLHGDLKAANILLTGPGRQVVIADFGLSQAMLAGQEAAVASGALTYSISPPEVLNDPLAPRTRAADVYAFAIVLLEIYTGLTTFRGLRTMDIRRLVTAGHRPTLPTDMPPCIAAIIEACWAHDPAARPSFAVVVQQLVAASEVLQLPCFTNGTVTVVGTQTMTDW